MIIFDESIESLQKEIDKRERLIEELIKKEEREPLLELINLRKEFEGVLKKHGLISEEVIDFVSKSSVKEIELLKEAEDKVDVKKIDNNKRIKLENEIKEIKNHLSLEKLKKQK